MSIWSARTCRSLVFAGAIAAASSNAGLVNATPRANICASLGLASGAVIRADGITREVADDQGRPECVLYTTKGRAYISVYSPSLAADVIKSWGFEIAYTTESLAGLGPGAESLYTKGHAVEALAFKHGGRFIWLTTAGRFMHPEMLAIAASIYAKT